MADSTGIQPYDRASFAATLVDDEVPGADLTSLHHVFGFPTDRRDNLRYVEPGVLVYVAGNYLVTLDLRTTPPRRGYVRGVDGRGVGAVVVHPFEPLVVVGEKGNDPNLYVFEYPSWQVVKVLKKGAVRGYSCLAFSPDGNKLASVAMAPDFTLSVWDWRAERVTLHTKAFGQDVYKVCFSPDDPMRLTTSGAGHIRFWRMARTFTGLKLQGDIGKFGKVELSDVGDFAELPDGKVISGTDSGSLLLWEGNFIKYRLVRPGGALCHEGAVSSVLLLRDPSGSGRGAQVVSGGADGKLCWWDFKTIDEAEIDMDRTTDFELSPSHELVVGGGVAIRTVIRGSGRSATNPPPAADAAGASGDGASGEGGGEGSHALVVDGRGGLWQLGLNEIVSLKDPANPLGGFDVDIESDEQGGDQLFEFHAGGITAMDVSPLDHFAATGGADGTVRCWDYVTKRELFRSSWGPKFKPLKSSKALKKKKPKAVLPEAPAPDSADDGDGDGAVAATETLEGRDGDSNNLASPQSSPSALEADYMNDFSPEPSTAEANAPPPPPAAVTTLKWAPVTVAPDGRSIFVGFSDGVVRVLWRGDAIAPKNSSTSSGTGGSLGSSNSKYAGKWVREQVFKPHNGAVSAVAFSTDGYFLATAGKDGKVFLFADFDASASTGKRTSSKAEGTRQFSPLGFVAVTREDPEVPESSPSSSGNEDGAAFATSLCFRSDDLALLLSASNGSVCEVNLSALRNGKANDLQLTTGGADSSGGGDDDDEGGNAAAAGGESSKKTESFALALPKAWHTMKRPKGDKASGVAAGGGGESLDGASAAAREGSGGGDGATAATGGDGSVVATSEVEEGEEEAAELPLPPALQCTYVRNRSGSTVPGQPSTASSEGENSTNVLPPFLVSFGGDLSGHIFECRGGVEHPVADLSVGSGPRASDKEAPRPAAACRMEYNPTGQFLLCGADDGGVSLRQTGEANKDGEKSGDLLEQCFMRLQPHDGDAGPVTGVSLSFDQKFLLTAAEDGQFVVHRIKVAGLEERAVAGLTERNKRITSLKHKIAYVAPPLPALPPPDALVKMLSSGEGEEEPAPEGFEDASSSALAEVAGDVKTPSMPPTKEASDILDPTAYSLEDAKLKTEADATAARAEKAKAAVLAIVGDLQKEYEKIVAANNAKPVQDRLSAAEMLVDPEYAAILEEQGEELVAEVHRECAYASEKSTLRLMKLMDRFTDPLAFEPAELDTFDLRGMTPSEDELAARRAGKRAAPLEVVSVRCFPAPKVSGPRAALLAQVKASMRLEERTHQNEERASAHKGANTTTGGDGNHRGGVGPGSGSEVAGGHTLEDGSIAAVSAEGGGGNSSSSSAGVDNTNSSTVGGGKSNGKANHQSQSQQQPDMSRKARRVVRVAALQALAEAKPGKDEDDPADVTAIAEAESTIGDFKRKAAPGYQLPPGAVVSADLKLRDLVLLDDAILKRKLNFNKRFNQLRDAKRAIAVSVTQAYQRIGAITSELHDGGLDASGAHDQDPDTFKAAHRSMQATKVSIEAARKAAGGGAAGDAAAQAAALSPPLPTLDAGREWPYARHLHTPQEMKQFKEAQEEAESQGLPVVPPEQVPPVSVVPGLVKGLAATARAAALHHSAHGGHGGGATKATVSAYSHRGASQAASHAAARALSSLPVLHFLDHQASTGLAPGAGVRSASQLAAASDSFKEGRRSMAVSNNGGGSPPGSFDSGSGSFDRPQSPQLYATAAELKEEDDWVRRVRLEAERANLKDRAAGHLEGFNKQLLALRRERLLLAADLAASEVRLLALLREYTLLQAFGVRDKSLAAKLDKCLRDKGETAAQTVEIRSQIKRKTTELSAAHASAADVAKDFLATVPPQHPFHEQLMKIFKRKIKRAKKRDLGDEDEDEGGSEEEEEEDDEDGDDEGDGEGEEEEVVDDSCPAGCDTGLYELVLVQRVRRLDQEDRVTDLAKEVDELTKGLTRLEVKEKSVDKDLTQTRAEIAKFQTEKQRSLDGLTVPVPLKVSQLCSFQGDGDDDGEEGEGNKASGGAGDDNSKNGALATTTQLATTGEAGYAATTTELTVEPPSPQSPLWGASLVAAQAKAAAAAAEEAMVNRVLTTDAGPDTHLLFPRAGLWQLSRRVVELQKDTEQQHANLVELQRTKNRLQKAKHSSEVAIAAQEAKNEGLQMLRFGQVVDMSIVEAGDQAAGRVHSEQQELAAAETNHDAALAALKRKERHLQEALLAATQENTTLLSRIADLSGRQFYLEKELNGDGGSGGGGGGGGGAPGSQGPALRAELEERAKLISIVKLQGQEVDALKAEVNLLRRKGGHVYVPPPPPDDAQQPPPM